jgi:hypothetical protein
MIPSPDGVQHLLARAKWTSAASATTCADMLSNTSATRTRHWWPMRQETSGRASPRRACSGPTPAPPDGSRTPRSPSVWGMRRRGDTRWSTAAVPAEGRLAPYAVSSSHYKIIVVRANRDDDQEEDG